MLGRKGFVSGLKKEKIKLILTHRPQAARMGKVVILAKENLQFLRIYSLVIKFCFGPDKKYLSRFIILKIDIRKLTLGCTMIFSGACLLRVSKNTRLVNWYFLTDNINLVLIHKAFTNK